MISQGGGGGEGRRCGRFAASASLAVGCWFLLLSRSRVGFGWFRGGESNFDGRFGAMSRGGLLSPVVRMGRRSLDIITEVWRHL